MNIFSKSKAVLSSLVFMGSLAYGSESNPLPLPGPRNLLTDYDISVENITDTQRDAIDFVKAFGFYKDKEEPNLYWVSPHFGVSDQYSVSQFGEINVIKLNKTISEWLKKSNDALNDSWDEIDDNDNFNDSMEEASVAFATGTDIGHENNEAGQILAKDKLFLGFSNLSDRRVAIIKAAIVNAMIDANKPIAANPTIEQFLAAIRSAKLDLAGTLTLSILQCHCPLLLKISPFLQFSLA